MEEFPLQFLHGLALAPPTSPASFLYTCVCFLISSSVTSSQLNRKQGS